MWDDMEIIDLTSNENKEIRFAKGEEKTFVWRVFSGGPVSSKITFLLDEGAKLKNIFLFSSPGSSDYDIDLKTIHLGECSFSETFIRGIGRNRSRARVLCEARAEMSAKHSDIWVDGRALLFDEAGCRIDPKLEIKTSEVKRAGHAAAVSRMSDEDIFYIATRGVGESEAIKLKSRGFLSAPLLKAGLDFKEAEKIVQPLLA